MTEQEKYMKQCAGKMQHRTLLSATYYYDENNSKPDAEIYECGFCGFFHIGTSKRNSTQPTPKKVKHKNDKDYDKIKIRKFRY
jgi:hypothetical protein